MRHSSCSPSLVHYSAQLNMAHSFSSSFITNHLFTGHFSIFIHKNILQKQYTYTFQLINYEFELTLINWCNSITSGDNQVI